MRVWRAERVHHRSRASRQRERLLTESRSPISLDDTKYFGEAFFPLVRPHQLLVGRGRSTEATKAVPCEQAQFILLLLIHRSACQACEPPGAAPQPSRQRPSRSSRAYFAIPRPRATGVAGDGLLRGDRVHPHAADGRFAQDNIVVEDNQVTVRMPKGDNPNAQDNWSWRYDRAAQRLAGDGVRRAGAPIVQSVLQGYNGTVMCYGQTGAGKTFTQIGSLESYQNRGITPRAIAEIFAYVSRPPAVRGDGQRLVRRDLPGHAHRPSLDAADGGADDGAARAGRGQARRLR